MSVGRRPSAGRCANSFEGRCLFCFNSRLRKAEWQVPFCLCGAAICGRFGVRSDARKRGVTGLNPPAGSPTIRRRELGSILKALRGERGWTADQLAEQLGFSPSKVSRLETGQRGASVRDIAKLCDLYQVDEAQRQRMADLAREGKQRAWWQPLNLPYATYIGLEAEAASISDYGLGVIPGLLQTPEYARAVVRTGEPGFAADEVEQRVHGRMTRQQLLFGQDAPRFEAVVDESVLHRVVGSPAVMQAQLERLLELSELPSVTLRVILFEAGALPAGNNKFIILSFELPAVSDVVYIEGLTGDLFLEDPADVEAYKATYQALVRLAADPEATRETITANVLRYHAQSG
jgi:transcriptional regulator with XRE-family HTH domain